MLSRCMSINIPFFVAQPHTLWISLVIDAQAEAFLKESYAEVAQQQQQ